MMDTYHHTSVIPACAPCAPLTRPPVQLRRDGRAARAGLQPSPKPSHTAKCMCERARRVPRARRLLVCVRVRACEAFDGSSNL
jgi:hypothetical protein